MQTGRASPGDDLKSLSFGPQAGHWDPPTHKFGAATLKPLQDVLRGVFGGEADALYLVLYGALLIVSCLALPKGIAFYIEKWHRKRYGNS